MLLYRMGSLMGLGSSTKLAVGVISDSGATTGKSNAGEISGSSWGFESG